MVIYLFVRMNACMHECSCIHVYGMRICIYIIIYLLYGYASYNLYNHFLCYFANVLCIGEGNKSAALSQGAAPVKPVKPPTQKKEVPPVSASIAASDKKGGDRPPEKERKKDVPPPRMQFDDENRRVKAKRRAVVNQTEARNRVELFRHLPQYERGTQLPYLESKFFQLDLVHPAVYKVGTWLSSVNNLRFLLQVSKRYYLFFICYNSIVTTIGEGGFKSWFSCKGEYIISLSSKSLGNNEK